MNIDLQKHDLVTIARGLIMIEKSVGRKLKDQDISAEMSAVLSKEQAEVYALRNKLTQAVLNFTETHTAKK